MNYADDYSGYGNKVLYRMCAERPLHKEVDIVGSKLWIIGRSYSAAIERKAGKNFKIENAARLIIESDIDSLIAGIANIERPTESNIHTVLHAHKYLTDILAKATGIDKRSLASKYLHFHCPRSVFIYDSIASRNIRALLRSKRIKFKIPQEFDIAYTDFSYRCLYYRDLLEAELGQLVTPRKLDTRLLEYGTKLTA